MRHPRKFLAAAALLALSAPVWVAAQPSPVAAPANAEDARLTAFLDAEFAQEVKMRPQLATRLGLKENEDKLDDISDSAALKLLDWRRSSVARMKAQFDRAKLSAKGQPTTTSGPMSSTAPSSSTSTGATSRRFIPSSTRCTRSCRTS